MYVPLKRAVIAGLLKYSNPSLDELLSYICHLYHDTDLMVDYCDEEEVKVILGTMMILGYVSKVGDRYYLDKRKLPRKYFTSFIEPILRIS